MGEQDEAVGRKPLSGVRVIDFSRVLAGPYCTALMADLGAEVIKIEGPAGDDYRHVGPFVNGESLLFESVNRSKRSIALDLKDPASVALARALIRTADVVVENFRPGVMKRLGLDAETLRAEQPALIYASISGFGQSGPNAMRPAYDIIVQAMSGLMDMTGAPDGEPTMIGEAIGDVAGGIFAAWAIAVALFERERAGQGRSIDIAMLDSLVSMMPTAACRSLMAKETPTRAGNRHALSAPFGAYAARNGQFAVAVLSNRLFEAFCSAIGRPELAEDPRFATDAERRRNEAALAEAIERWAGGRDVAEAVEALSAAGVPAAPIQSVAEVWASEQATARGLASSVDHHDLGPLLAPEQPVHFAGAPRGGRAPAPKLDEHRDAVLDLVAKEKRA